MAIPEPAWDERSGRHSAAQVSNGLGAERCHYSWLVARTHIRSLPPAERHAPNRYAARRAPCLWLESGSMKIFNPERASSRAYVCVCVHACQLLVLTGSINFLQRENDQGTETDR